jgi:hypothetical protein
MSSVSKLNRKAVAVIFAVAILLVTIPAICYAMESTPYRVESDPAKPSPAPIDAVSYEEPFNCLNTRQLAWYGMP